MKTGFAGLIRLVAFDTLRFCGSVTAKQGRGKDIFYAWSFFQHPARMAAFKLPWYTLAGSRRKNPPLYVL